MEGTHRDHWYQSLCKHFHRDSPRGKLGLLSTWDVLTQQELQGNSSLSPAPNFSSCIMKTKLSVSEITLLLLQSFDDSSSSQRKGNTQHLMWRTDRNHHKNVNWQSLCDPGKNPNHTNVLLQQDMFINHTQSHPQKHNPSRDLFFNISLLEDDTGGTVLDYQEIHNSCLFGVAKVWPQMPVRS